MLEDIRDNIIGILMVLGIGLGAVVIIWGIILLIYSIKWETSEQNVSGIVYNTKNNQFISGNTAFSVRAGENTLITEENQSSFCLPPNSEYKELVNRAAADKTIKVNVTTQKFFMIAAPWYCPAFIKVTEVK